MQAVGQAHDAARVVYSIKPEAEAVMPAGTGTGSNTRGTHTGQSSGIDPSVSSSSHTGLDRDSGASTSSMPHDTGSGPGQGVASMHSYNSSSVWRGEAEEQEVVNSNATGMQISFLGTAGSLDSRTRQVTSPCIVCMQHLIPA